jgi:PKD repeat protein
VPEGTPAVFSVLAGGAAPLSFQWQRNGMEIPGATERLYRTDGAVMSDHGARYTCKVSNAEGSAVSEPAALTVISSGLVRLRNGEAVSGAVNEGEWRRYHFRVPADATELTFRTSGTSDDVDLYVRKGQLPSDSAWDFRPYSVLGDEWVRVDEATSPALTGGVWFCAVHGFKGSSYNLTASHNGTGHDPGSILLSGPSATPNPAMAGENVVFSVALSDAAGAGFGCFWSFGDGTRATGATVDHAYAASGSYIATVTITNLEFSMTAGVTVDVTARPEPMDVARLRIRLNFKKEGRDGCSMKAGLALPEGFEPEGVTAALDIGDARFVFTLDGKGRARSAHGRMALKAGGRQGLSVNLKNGNWGGLWAPRGMRNEEARNVTITMPVRLTLSAGASGETVYVAEKSLRYTARAGRGGKAR